MIRPAVVFIESNTTGTGGVLVEKALDRGYEVHFLSADPTRYPFLAEQWVLPTVTDTSDVAGLATLVEQLKPSAVISTSEYYLETAAELARKFGLYGPDPEAVARCRHKGRLAEALIAAQVPAPKTVVIQRMADLDRVEQALHFPMVVKPAQGSGSIGVRLCRNASELHEHLGYLLKVKGNERGLTVVAEAVVQNFVDGREFSVEIMGTEQGFEVFGVTQKHLGAPPHFLEIGHDFPAILAPEEEASLIEVARLGLRATGLTRGPAHVELRLLAGHAQLIEINPRLAGGMIPVLIEQALGLDPLDCWLDFALFGRSTMEKHCQKGASIRFFVPAQSGTLVCVPDPDILKQLPGIQRAQVSRKQGETCNLNGDFRDRLGWVISVADDPRESAQLAQAAIEMHEVQVATEGQLAKPTGFNEDARTALHETARRIVRHQPTAQARLLELNRLVAMDQAHLLMLLRCGLVSSSKACSVLHAIRALIQDRFGDLLQQPAARGTYLLYEDALIERCGLALGGAVHLGRSRNDMNAADFKMALREPFAQTNAALWNLRRSLMDAAEKFAHVAMPVYSQYQPGLPGTYGYYLLGVEEALSRDQQGLLQCLDALNCSPLGAGAGAGTTLPINPAITAELLGFKSVAHHALDAVASRDLGMRLMAALATAGVTLSRFLQDLQMWTTREFNFLAVPDNLTGGSSMMPQKRNPYLLEMAQGRAAVPNSVLMELLQGMIKTPFSNAIQVGTEAVKPMARGWQSLSEAAALTELFVSGCETHRAAMQAAMVDGQVMATAVAEALAATGDMSFREAHNRVGQLLRAAHGPVAPLIKAAFPECAHAFPADPDQWPAAFASGGGPGQASQTRTRAWQRLSEDGALMRAAKRSWALAQRDLEREVDRLLEQDHRAASSSPSHV